MKQQRICPGQLRDTTMCDCVARLLPLYTAAPADQPDSVLSDYPNPHGIIAALKIMVDVMFPGKMAPSAITADELGVFLTLQLSQGWRNLRPEIARALPFRWRGEAARIARPGRRRPPPAAELAREATRIMREFYDRMPDVRRLLVEDVQAAYNGDPAALSYAEVQLAYPGLLAITSHRLAHELYRLDVPIVPRIMSEWTHAQTGVDIHPGAQIGRGFFVDHATGVVIGETTRIGNNVKIYQGVTLGARSFPLDKHGRPIKHIQRHPTVEDDVVIYANATILGGDTIIGRGSTVGGNVFLMESVPPNSFVGHEHPKLRIKPRG